MEKATAIRITEKDSVVTALKEISAGETVYYFDNGALQSIEAKETVPVYHKIALHPIKKGDIVLKYGEIIGAAMEDIDKGQWVAHHNILSLPRNYEDELNK